MKHNFQNNNKKMPFLYMLMLILVEINGNRQKQNRCIL